MENKVCTKCKLEKPLNDFYNQKNGKNGKRSSCKICSNKDNLSRYDKSNSLKSYYKNKDKILENQRLKYAEDSSKKKIYVKNNKEEIYRKNSEYHKKWYKNNKDKKLLKNKLYIQKRESEDIEFKLKLKLRSRLTMALKNYVNRPFKERNIQILIGCSLEELKLHLEKQFKEDMNWNNHGKVWHIDHIKPCSLFNLIEVEEQRKCFNYSNLQPLYAQENLKKNNKYETE
jgi:hypothetical protein